jgi:VWFA-related protein
MNRNLACRLLRICAVSFLFQICGGIHAPAQQPDKPIHPERQEQTDDDVIRISTDLVQTGVSVFDKKGKFIDGLRQDDFELRVDNKPVNVSFFERMASSSLLDKAQVKTTRTDARAMPKNSAANSLALKAPSRGRIVVFFVDDIHLGPVSVKSARDTINKFIDVDMGQNDLVAIASSSGQIGFLQQYTDDKDVLKAAVSRLTFRNFGTRDTEVPTMTDGQAVLIRQGDKAVFGFFVEETMRIYEIPRPKAEEIVGRRARILVEQTAGYNKATLSALETLARRSAALPARKLIFFISDGFPLDSQTSDVLDRLRRITDASIRAGVTIYTIDARGLVTDMMDASAENSPSGSAAFASRLVGEDVLNTLAADTGGRFIHNTNEPAPELTKALNETSVYYLLAWRPTEESGNKKFRNIEVSIKNRPELSVRFQRGYFEKAPDLTQSEPAAAKANAHVDPLRQAINSLAPKSALPTWLTLAYLDTPGEGPTVVTSMKVETNGLKFESPTGAHAAAVEIAGTVFDANGKAIDNFDRHLSVTSPATPGSQPPDIVFNYRTKLKPGLYQVRVGAIERATGTVGSATAWVKIPDVSKRGMAMSSIILGDEKPEASEQAKASNLLVEGMRVSVDHKFERSSNLLYLVYIYNATHADATSAARPDIALQVKIFRDDQMVVALPPRQLSIESQDPNRLASAAEIPLQELPTGQYVLQITATDRTAAASVSERVRFEIR